MLWLEMAAFKFWAERKGKGADRINAPFIEFFYQIYTANIFEKHVFFRFLAV